MTAKPTLFTMTAALALAACTNLSDTLAPFDAKVSKPSPSPVKAAQGDHVPSIAPGTVLALPKPGDLGRRVEVVQFVTLRFGGEQLAFEARLSIKPDRLMLVGIDGMGRRAMTVVWDGLTLMVEPAPWLPPEVRPANILADVIVLFFPTAAVRKALETSGCDLALSAQKRVVRCGETEVLRAEYEGRPSSPWNSKLRYSNLAWGYEAEVRSAEVTP